MITLLRQPNEVSFSRNPVLFEFQTDNLYSTLGNPFQATMQFNATKGAGSSFTLSWQGASVTFDFVTGAIGDNGRQLPAYVSGTTSEWLDEVIAALRLNYYVESAFTIEKGVSGISLIFKSKQNSGAFNIVYTATANMTGVSWSTNAYATDRLLRKNFALYLEIWVEREDRTAFDRYTQSTVEVDSDGWAVWNIQQYLTAILLQDGPVLPDLENNGVVVDNRSVRRFYVRYAEMFGDPQRIARVYQSETFTAVLGGFADDYLNRKLPDYFRSFGLLEWMNPTRSLHQLHKDQPAFGSIVNFDRDYTDVEIKYRILYIDQMEEVHGLFSLEEWKLNSKLIIPTGITNALAGGLRSTLISGVLVWLESEGNRISGNFEAYFDLPPRPALTPLLYLNSCGCFQTIYTYGKRTIGYDVDKTAEAFTTKVIPEPMAHTLKELGVKSRNVIKINSGFFPYFMVQRFRDFMLSSYKYIYIDGKWRPVVLDSNAVEEYSDFENMKAISFSLKFSNEEFLWGK